MYPNNGNYYGGSSQPTQPGWVLGSDNANTNINYPQLDNNAYVSPQIQVQGQGFSGGQGFSYQQPNYNQGFNNQPYSQGFNNQGFNNQGFQNQPYQNQGYSGQQGYQNQGFNQGFNQNSFNNNQGFNNQSSNKNFSNFSVPDEFQMVQKLLTIGMDMKLQQNGSQFGFIKQKMLSIGRTFQLQNSTGAVVAVAKQKVFTIGSDFEIFDGSNTKIGSIKEEVLKSMFSIHRKYTVFDRNGVSVAFTKQLELVNKAGIQVFGTMSNNLEAKFSEQWMSFLKQKWDIRFLGSSVDRRLLIFFPSISSQRQEQKSLNSANNY